MTMVIRDAGKIVSEVEEGSSRESNVASYSISNLSHDHIPYSREVKVERRISSIFTINPCICKVQGKYRMPVPK